MQKPEHRRRLLLEALEPRQMMTYYPVPASLQTFGFTENYMPEQHVLTSKNDSFLSAPTAGNKLTVGLNYMKAHAADFDLTVNDFNHVQLTNQYTNPSTGITHIYWQQTFNGLPVANAFASVHLTSAGRVISADSSLIPGLPHPASPTPLSPSLSATQAANQYALALTTSILSPSHVDSTSTARDQQTVITIPDLSNSPTVLKLQYVPRPGGVALAWNINYLSKTGDRWWDSAVSADSAYNPGRVVRLADWVWNASYNVFEAPTSNPLDGVTIPADLRTIATDPQSTVASPQGWHDTTIAIGGDFTDTRGNNVNAQEDRDNNNTGGFRPSGGGALNFDFPLDLTQAPTTWESAAITNLFYWVNLSHDISFVHGFDEVSGNFQVTNFSGQGAGNDPVEADAQDGSGFNNANMQTPPDGISGRIQMFQFNITNPNRDGDLDGSIIAHEFAHGISNRLTGGPANANALQALQSGGMGEGWSDWFGLMLDIEPSHNKNTPQALGNWVLGQPSTGTGVRRFPYSFDMTIDPLTLDDFNGGFPNNEVHNAGEIWCSAIYDMTWLLIEKHGFSTDLYSQTGGQNVAMNIILEGMKLQPANPSFLEARDAILAADLALYGGDNFDEIWDAFARRGFGLSADDGPDSDSPVVIEAFDRPPPLARVRGTVVQDINFNRRLDALDTPLAGWTVYVDANNNSAFDTGEKNAITAADGTYQLTFFGTNQVTIRQVVMPDFKQSFPVNNAGYNVTPPGQGLVLTGIDFGNEALPGKVSGIKWNDRDGDGVRDLDDPLTIGINELEPGMEGIIIYDDINNDGMIGILEPAAMTDFFGNYTIHNVQSGGGHVIRELNKPGLAQTYPDPLGITGGAHVNVNVLPNQTTLNINFGNRNAFDWGDAPTDVQSGFAASYPTTLAQNGARHGLLAGFGLGVAGDRDANGQPDANATGDDLNGATPDDEDGIIIPPLTPGAQDVNLVVHVRHGGYSAGLLQGWVDWNRDGDWDDDGEQIIKDLRVRETTDGTLVPIDVPAGLELGRTFARFRYGIQPGIGPTGADGAGEVEDHSLVLLDNIPVAFPDEYGGINFPPVIKQDSVQNALTPSPLANDFGTVNGGPLFIVSDFPTLSDNGGLVELSGDQTTLLYTPPAGFVGDDKIRYRVRDNAFPVANVSSPTPNTEILIHVTAKDPQGVDDTVTIACQGTIAPCVATPTFITLQPAPGKNLTGANSNDVSPDPVNTRIVQSSVTRLTPGPIPVGESFDFAGLGANPTTFRFRPGSNFRGTVQYRYDIDDNDPLTNPSSAVVTIQVVNFVSGVPQPAPSHLAQLELQYLDLAGNPIAAIDTDQDFIVRVVATDIAPADLDGAGPLVPRTSMGNPIRGVETAYLDLLYDSSLAAPISSATNPLGFVITFDGKPGTVPTGGTELDSSSVATSPAPTATAFSGMLAELPNVDNFFNGNYLVFTSGLLIGQRARINDYDGATRRFVFEAGSFTDIPAVNANFIVERALYNNSQLGTPNAPAPGSIDEVGGSHLDAATTTTVGAGGQTVFSARFRAGSDPGNFNAFGDPAESTPDLTRVVITNRPNVAPNEIRILTDAQVFFRSPPALIITDAVGEFSNFHNPLDVNDDSFVSPIDALLVINDLNANGAREISQISIGASGQLPQGYVDVNIDAHVAPIDALLVINHLNLGASGASFVGPTGGEAEGEGEAAQASALSSSSDSSSDPLDSAVAALAVGVAEAGNSGVEEVSSDDAGDVLATTSAPPASSSLPGAGTSSTGSSASDNSETEAVDEVFSQLGSSLRKSFLARPGKR